MKKFNSKKGFTIVELVIVIAVIAILAAVLIPTFSSVTQAARQSAAQQQAKAGMDSLLVLTQGVLPEGTSFYVFEDKANTKADYCFIYKGNKLTEGEANQTAPIFDTTKSSYSIYVSTKSLEGTEDNYNGFTDSALTMVKSILGVTATGDETEWQSVAKGYTCKVDGKVVNVYYTTDFNETLVAFVSDGTVTAPAETTAATTTPATP